MPRLWNETIEDHRRAVQEAILDSTAALIQQHGLTAVTMAQIAQATGIGRATLYKYFPDVEAILLAWHERQVAHHLAHLAAVGGHGEDPGRRLDEVLHAYARIRQEHPDHDLAATLHRGGHMTTARQRLHDFLTGLLADAADAGEVRDDVPPGELAAFCLHSLGAATGLPSPAAADRLVAVTRAGLRPQP